ncbi:fucose permease [Roseiarcus fermentans]|uniref:Fucose permease n=1 Tax=Roseiarcus fermentans TaxID=1473586 RepID=A0A366EXP7_9HYPH|nr:MFS transporter [Roseiarcus fermentans]RBP06235.1 fucose permease [Roseiarcus fermentans]
MADNASLSRTDSTLRRTVQDHIDELPMWADGTTLPSVPMTGMQWLIWSLAAAGKFFEGYVVFMTGVALPLFSREFNIGAFEHGLIGAASLFGILVGAITLGGLSDRFGRKPMFVIEMIIFVAFLVALCFATNYIQVVFFLFAQGLALGCDYPTAHMIISENIPSSKRGKLVLGAFAFQAVGALVGTGIGFLVLSLLPELGAWRWMYASAVIPAVLVTIGRFYIVESANWLLGRGEVAKAEHEAKRLLVRKPQYPGDIKLAAAAASQSPAESGQSFAALFNSVNRRATILASVPWFLQDLGTYGIGIFTPTILAAAVGGTSDHARSIADVILQDMVAAKGAALITSLLILGILFAVLLADVVGRIRLQVFGFIGCAVGLFLASLSAYFADGEELLLIFAGFMLFNFMTNLGPNAQTYLLAGEVFPTAIRGKGAGFAAAFAKVGAVLTAFLFPVLLDSIGTQALLYGLIVTSLLGAAVTWLYRIETTGVNLETLSAKPGSLR